MDEAGKTIAIEISIHTPARGVTGFDYYRFIRQNNFNPHSRKGSDKIEKGKQEPSIISIHTPARGVTRRKNLIFCLQRNFNPHSRKGSDGRSLCCTHCINNFNPHSRKGSDPDDIGKIRMFVISIHTPARGVT